MTTTPTRMLMPDPVQVAYRVGVKPCARAPKLVWKWVWRGHAMILPLLHWNDMAYPKDQNEALKVLWCKSIANMDRTSLAYDDEWTYDMMPPISRRVLLKWRFVRALFPRLHHANIEIRTVYLNRIIQQLLQHPPPHVTKIRIVALGGGYDVRACRFLSLYPDVLVKAYELDLPHVVESKHKMLQRLQQRRMAKARTPTQQHYDAVETGEHGPTETAIRLPTLRSCDLNDVHGSVRKMLNEIMVGSAGEQQSSSSRRAWHTIFVSEGVMIYLDPGVPGAILRLCSGLVSSSGGTASFCFADRLENVPGADQEAAVEELANHGWELLDWCPKPGLARHMGLASLRRTN